MSAPYPIDRPVRRTDFELLFDGSTRRIQSWLLEHSRVDRSVIASLFRQLRGAVPQIASLPLNQRGCYPILFTLPGGRSIEVPAGALFTHLVWIDRRIALQGKLLEEFDGYVNIGAGDVPLANLGGSPTWRERWGSWLFDPNHPAKKMKYLYPLNALLTALNQKFPEWQTEILPQLNEWKEKSPFAHHASLALSQLGIVEGDVRKRYATFGTELRAALSAMENESLELPSLKKGRELLLQLSHFKFTRVSFHRFLDDFIPKCLAANCNPSLPIYEFPSLTFKNLGHEIVRANDQLQSIPHQYLQTGFVHQWKCLQGALGFNFDPNGRSNPPWIHSIQRRVGGKECVVLRHATPTFDSPFGLLMRMLSSPSAIIPEYRAHLSAEPHLKTLYCSHQYKEARAEGARVAAIRELEKEHPNFSFIGLPMDGPIWEGEGEILSSLSEEINGFTLPSNPELREKVVAEAPRLLNGVIRLYFRGVKPETLAGKRALLLLFYSELKDLIKGEIEADFVASPCKDHKDRGNVSVTVDMVKNLMKLGKENDPVSLRELFISVLSPFVIKNQHIIPERLEAAITVIQLLSNLSEQEKETIRKTPLTSFRIEEQVVPKEGFHWTQLVGRGQFIEMVEAAKRLDEVRTIQDPDYMRKQMVPYFVKGEWNLAKLKQQIEDDLLRFELRFGGKRVKKFEELCSQLNVGVAIFDQVAISDIELSPQQIRAISVMSVLQQGAVFDIDQDVHDYFQNNQLGFTVVQGQLEPARHAILQLINEFEKGKEVQGQVQKGLTEWPERFSLYLKSAVARGLLPPKFCPGVLGGETIVPIFPTRLELTFEKGRYRLVAKQEFQLVEVTEVQRCFYPIVGDTVWKEGESTTHSWKFV